MNRDIEAAVLVVRLHTTRDALAFLTKGQTDDRAVGRKALLVAFLLDSTLIGTQRQLAKRMGVTEQRASQMLKSIRRKLHWE